VLRAQSEAQTQVLMRQAERTTQGDQEEAVRNKSLSQIQEAPPSSEQRSSREASEEVVDERPVQGQDEYYLEDDTSKQGGSP